RTLRAADAVNLPVPLPAPALLEYRAIHVNLDTGMPQILSNLQWEVGGGDRVVHPQPAACAHRHFHQRGMPGPPTREQILQAKLFEGTYREIRDGGQHWSVVVMDEHILLTAALDADERVSDEHRDHMSEVCRSRRIAKHDDVRSRLHGLLALRGATRS